MAALAVDKQVFFASSMRGAKYVYENFEDDCETPTQKMQLTPHVLKVDQAQQIEEALNKCMEEAAEGDVEKASSHTNHAMCGEVMATYAWLMNHNGAQLKGKQPKPLVVAWNKNTNNMMDPCDRKDPQNPNQWGCKNFVGVDGMDYEVVEKNTKAEPYYKIVTGRHQQELPKVQEKQLGGGRGGGRGGRGGRGGKPKREFAFEA